MSLVQDAWTGDWDGAVKSGFWLLFCCGACFLLARAGKSLSVYGTWVVSREWALGAHLLDAEALRALRVEWSNSRGEYGATRWELHAEPHDGRTVRLLSALKEQKRLTLSGNLLVAVDRAAPDSKRAERELDAAEVRAVDADERKTRWTLNGRYPWELRSHLQSGRVVPLLTWLQSEEEATWLAHVPWEALEDRKHR